MIRKYKALGLVLVAMLALGGLVAEGAAAQPITSESEATFFTGSQEQLLEFKTSHGVVKCMEATFTAQATEKTVSELTVTPDWPTKTISGFGNCVGYGFVNTHVNANGCSFTFTTPTKLAAGEVTWGTEQLHLLCPTGKAIEVTPTSGGVSVCTQFIPPQTPTGGHVVGTNTGTSGTGMEVTLNITLEKLHYTGSQANNVGPCTNGETHSEATLSGRLLVKCYSNATHTTRTGCTFS